MRPQGPLRNSTAATRSGICNSTLRKYMSVFSRSSAEPVHFLARDGHLRHQHVAGERLGDVDRLVVGAAEGEVVEVMVVMPLGMDEVGRQHVGVEAPDADAQVAH